MHVFICITKLLSRNNLTKHERNITLYFTQSAESARSFLEIMKIIGATLSQRVTQEVSCMIFEFSSAICTNLRDFAGVEQIQVL